MHTKNIEVPALVIWIAPYRHQGVRSDESSQARSACKLAREKLDLIGTYRRYADDAGDQGVGFRVELAVAIGEVEYLREASHSNDRRNGFRHCYLTKPDTTRAQQVHEAADVVMKLVQELSTHATDLEIFVVDDRDIAESVFMSAARRMAKAFPGAHRCILISTKDVTHRSVMTALSEEELSKRQARP